MDFIIFLREGRIANMGVHNHLYNSDEDYKQLIDSSKMASNQTEESISQKKILDEIKDDLPDIRFSSPDWSDVKPLKLDGSDSESSLSQVLDLETRDNVEKGDTLLSGRLILDERIGTGNISWDTYKYYIGAGGGLLIISFVICWLILQAMASSFANWWLGYWISQGSANV